MISTALGQLESVLLSDYLNNQKRVLLSHTEGNVATLYRWSEQIYKLLVSGVIFYKYCVPKLLILFIIKQSYSKTEKQAFL